MPPKAKNAKPSSSRAKSGTQKTLAGFGFKGSKKESRPVTSDDEDSDDPPAAVEDDEEEDDEEEDDDVPMTSTTKTSGTTKPRTTATKKQGRPDLSDLPPMTNIADIFADIVDRMPQLLEFAQAFRGRKIRVATMCSGTESPLLALDLVSRALKRNHNVELTFEHVFSCEIVPWKQAYIERNFSPPLLFRDVTELGNEEATTAYGAKATVPLDVDLLIAGTSCVDYSTLNNAKQDIDAKGESGETFRGMMRWVERAQPTIVILENVCSAPWARVKGYFEDASYGATFGRLDTKNYYIPHTRTRGYLCAIRKMGESRPKKWWETVKSMQRPASVPYDAFLLSSDDPRIQQGREKLLKEEVNRTKVNDWSKCETRHARARQEEELGNRRPLTNWNENGTCKMQDFAWIDWANTQVDRVWDLMDISFMRAADKGYDATFKSILWNLSQNVDRQIGSSVAGISPCLTPTMIAYLNFRGGPMLGIEALALQGLPVDQLVLTRETEDQLADLAGNAMSSTVVGTAILSALCVAKDLLDKAVPDAEEKDEDEAMIVEVPEGTAIPGESAVTGLEQLSEGPLDLAKAVDIPLKDLLAKAARSARLCACEGRVTVTSAEVSRCKDCGHTSCVRCGGRPEHNYEVVDVETSPRIQPLEFSKEAIAAFPMCLTVTGITQESLEALKPSVVGTIKESVWKAYTKAVLAAVSLELRFHSLKRQATWVAVFDSPTGSLQFHLDPKNPRWILYAKPESSEPTNSPTRRMLGHAIARLKVSDTLMKTDEGWELSLPSASSFEVQISGVVDPSAEGGGFSPAWEVRLGLQRAPLKAKKVWSKIKISIDEENQAALDTDIAGVYRWLPGCAAANASLHVKETTDDSVPPVFFFLDPGRCTDGDEDAFVFSHSHRRYDYGESRPLLATLDSRYRQSDSEHPQKFTCNVKSTWVPAPFASLKAATTEDAVAATPTKSLTFAVGSDVCKSAQAMLTCKVRLPFEADDNVWPKNEWKEVDRIHERQTFQAIAFVTERLREVPGQGQWLKTDFTESQHACKSCAPDAPAINWVLDPKAKGKAGTKKSALALEDAKQAGVYERALKTRPTPFITQLRRGEDEFGYVRVGINIASLTHRVVTRLPSKGRSNPIETSYRITTDYMPPAKLWRPKFALKSNRQDVEHDQPPKFKGQLRPEQQRSLTWMLAQERPDVEEFEEEEIAEAILEPLGWRAEAKAVRKVRVRGGILADEVGYGKTVISLALIACSAARDDFKKPKKSVTNGRIPVKATLIIVPPHLVKQWEAEAIRFLGKKYTILVIMSATSWKSKTVEDIQDADIVIVPSNLFSGVGYLASIAAFGAAGALPPSYGRYFKDRLEKTLEGIRAQTQLIREDGPEPVWEKILEGDKIDTSLQKLPVAEPSKRLRGQKFRDAAEAKALAATKAAKVPAPVKKEAGVKGERLRMLDVYIPYTADDLRRGIKPPAAKPKSEPTSDVEMCAPESDKEDRTIRKRASRPSIIIESDDEDEAPKRKATAKGRKKDVDFEEAFIVSDDDESSPTADESEASGSPSEDVVSDDSAPKAKGKGKAKPKAKVLPPSKKPAAAAAKPSKKRKSTALSDVEDKKAAKKPKAAPKAKPSVVSQDPWELDSKKVRKDWTLMHSPPLEMFYWNRIIVDEYTYLKEEAHALITELKGTNRWVLSGTPPIHDFASLKTIAVFLGIHLGVDDEDENPTTSRGSERTAAEKFHSFREVRSVDWYAHRYEVGQRFLDQFMRQNIAEIDEIIFHEHLEMIQLPAAERALERELDHTLRAQDMNIRRGKKTQSDRDLRIMKSIRESSSAEEALIKCVAFYDNVQSGTDNAMKACDYVVKVRKAELDDCQIDIYKTLVRLERQQTALGTKGGDTHYAEWCKNTQDFGVGDHEATRVVREIYDHAKKGKSWKPVKSKGEDASEESSEEEDDKLVTKGRKVFKNDQERADAIWEHRETTHSLRQTVRELIGRVRSYRYFEAVRDIQREHETFTVDCQRCGRKAVPKDEACLLSSCGHVGCASCVRQCAAEHEACFLAATSECQAPAQLLNIVTATSLGTDDEIKDARRHFGKKLEVVVNLIKKRIPKDERVLLFVQYVDLMKKVYEALEANNISCVQIQGTASQQSEKLLQFQNNAKEEKVLLLSLEDESASGANLTVANHAIFLSPMFAKSKEHYKATETQAIGRIRRYGQLREVNVWRFVARDTIDVEIYERFTGRNFQREVDEAAIAPKPEAEQPIDVDEVRVAKSSAEQPIVVDDAAKPKSVSEQPKATEVDTTESDDGQPIVVDDNTLEAHPTATQDEDLVMDSTMEIRPSGSTADQASSPESSAASDHAGGTTSASASNRSDSPSASTSAGDVADIVASLTVTPGKPTVKRGSPRPVDEDIVLLDD